MLTRYLARFDNYAAHLRANPAERREIQNLAFFFAGVFVAWLALH